MVQFLPLFGRNSAACMEYYTIMYMLLIVTQMMLDAATFQNLIEVTAPLEAVEVDTNMNLYQCIIIPIHCLQATLQFFFGFDLYKATVKKSYRRARNWQMIFFCLLAVEVSLFFAYISLAKCFSVFSYLTAAAIFFKGYLVWPLRIFLEDCSNEVCVPLAQTLDYQLQQPKNEPRTNRPGSSAVPAKFTF